jgi:tRNA pseudouridine38-40 synthase
VRRARFLVAYDGAPFHGFAENDGVATVLGAFRAALERVVRQPVDLVGAGRTDAGVHAWGQVISGDLPADTDLDDIARRLNKLLAPSIGVRSAVWTEDDFDARFSATARHYRYHVWNDAAPNPLLAASSWHVPQPLLAPVMRAAGDALIGEHDFSSFCRRVKVDADEPEKSRTRRVLALRWTEPEAHLFRLEISATAFCHQMVRSIAGTLVDVGLGRISAGDVTAILRARDRNTAGQVAPPHGLVLWQVDYDER